MPSFTDLPPASNLQEPISDTHVQNMQTHLFSKLSEKTFTQKPKLVLVSSQTIEELESRVARKRAIKKANENLGLTYAPPCPLLNAASQRLRQYVYGNREDLIDWKNAYVLRQVIRVKGSEGFDSLLLQALDHICKTLAETLPDRAGDDNP